VSSMAHGRFHALCSFEVRQNSDILYLSRINQDLVLAGMSRRRTQRALHLSLGRHALLRSSHYFVERSLRLTITYFYVHPTI
jgi:hypothetical protein